MAEIRERMADRGKRPDAKAVADWIGPANWRRWTRILRFIGDNYPGIFPADDWVYGGKKYGWGLRFKKSKSFCTLIPERGRLVLMIVFGGPEREKAETILPELSADVRARYAAATTYHDGKWLALPIERDETLGDVEKLLAVKRKPKCK